MTTNQKPKRARHERWLRRRRQRNRPNVNREARLPSKPKLLRPLARPERKPTRRCSRIWTANWPSLNQTRMSGVVRVKVIARRMNTTGERLIADLYSARLPLTFLDLRLISQSARFSVHRASASDPARLLRRTSEAAIALVAAVHRPSEIPFRRTRRHPLLRHHRVTLLGPSIRTIGKALMTGLSRTFGSLVSPSSIHNLAPYRHIGATRRTHSSH